MAEGGSLIGRVLQNTYRIERKISAGSMGAIYELSHLRLSRKKLAVKVLHPSVIEHKSMLARFRREAEVTSAIGHPHIIDVLDINEMDDGSPYIIMERLFGEDLGQRIDRRKRLTLRETASILRQAASALDAAHTEGVVHRDLKPPNIFLCKQGERDDYVKLLDFGISKVLGAGQAMTGINDVIGSPSYMAPEQIVSPSDVGPRIDVYAMGALVYEMLTGEPPIMAKTVMLLFEAVQKRVPPPMHHRQRDIPREISAVVARALRKNRDERYGTMRELWQAFEAALAAANVEFEEQSAIGDKAFVGWASAQPRGTGPGFPIVPQLTGPQRPIAATAAAAAAAAAAAPRDRANDDEDLDDHELDESTLSGIDDKLTGSIAFDDDDEAGPFAGRSDFDEDAETISRPLASNEDEAASAAPPAPPPPPAPRPALAAAMPRLAPAPTARRRFPTVLVVVLTAAVTGAVTGLIVANRDGDDKSSARSKGSASGKVSTSGGGSASGSGGHRGSASGSSVSVGGGVPRARADAAPTANTNAAGSAAARADASATSPRDAAARKRDYWPLGRRPEPGDEKWLAQQRRRRERLAKERARKRQSARSDAGAEKIDARSAAPAPSSPPDARGASWAD
ncbi:MAG: serine/threonine protein kinase [Myxococcales bacterium]|nr:serine/threonine protein kinase [Myxococcales bacterium]